MTDKEIFRELFDLAEASKSSHVVVAAGLVRGGKLLLSSVSFGTPHRHAEDLLLEKIKMQNIEINSGDALYVTLQPCGYRAPRGDWEGHGDCTTKIINSPIKKVVYAFPDSQYSVGADERLEKAGVGSSLVDDAEVKEEAQKIFNSAPLHKDYI